MITEQSPVEGEPRHALERAAAANASAAGRQREEPFRRRQISVVAAAWLRV
jgi:hypothetical protein